MLLEFSELSVIFFGWAGRNWQNSRSSGSNLLGDIAMQDLIYVAIALAFFVISIEYVKFCDAVK